MTMSISFAIYSTWRVYSGLQYFFLSALSWFVLLTLKPTHFFMNKSVNISSINLHFSNNENNVLITEIKFIKFDHCMMS